MPHKAAILVFALAIRKHMFAAMSGGFSVPFAAAAVWFDNVYAKLIFAALAFGATWFAAYVIWNAEHDKVTKLEEKIRPKLKCSFGINDAGCVRPNTTITTYIADPVIGRQNLTIQPSTGIQILASVGATYYRAKIEADSINSVSNCCGFLLSITKDGATVFEGETPILPFAPALDADSTAKSIRAGVPAYLDFLYITDAHDVRIPVHGAKSSSVNFDQLISQPGTYIIGAVVTSPDTVPLPVTLKLVWGGIRQTAEISSVST